MAGINKAILVGNLGIDPELTQTNSGQPVCNFSVATSDQWTDKNTGEKVEKTEWHRVCIFGKLAAVANNYLSKGSKVYLEGKVQTRKWVDNTGGDRYTTEIIVSGFSGQLQLLDKKQQIEPSDDRPFEDDIPF